MCSFLNGLVIISALSWLRFAAGLPGPSEYQCSGEEVINRDVCIIGGGSSGTYAAVQLHDSGKSVVVVEKENVLGGHTNTFIDPQTNQTVDFGVVVFHNLQIVKDYFNRLNVPFVVTSAAGGASGNQTSFVDFLTGEVVRNFTLPDPITGLAAYAAQQALFPQIQNGFFLPDPVPDDLLLPFGQFVATSRTLP